MSAISKSAAEAVGSARSRPVNLSSASARWAVVALTAAAGALRFSTLGTQSYWYDEGVTVQLVRMGFSRMLSTIPYSESTPPLYYVVAWAWARLFGTGEVGLRALSAAFGTALVVVAYGAAAALVSRRAAVVAAALVAVNPLLFWYSQEARAYSLLTLFGGLSFMFFARLLNGGRSADLWLWSAASALALTTHYFAMFLIVPEGVWLVVRRRARSVWLAAGLIVAVGGALLPLAIHQRSTNPKYTFQEIPLSTRIGQIPKQFLVGFDSPAEKLMTIFGGALVVVALWQLVTRAERREARGVASAGVVGVVSVALPVVLVLVGLDYLKTQNLTAAIVPCAILAAAGFAASRAGLAAAAALVVLSIFVIVSVDTNVQFQREDWRTAARSLGAPETARALVVTPAEGSLLFQVYEPDTVLLARRGTAVSEIDLVGLADKQRLGRYVPPRDLRRPTPAPGFRQVGRIDGATFTIVRFRAATPRWVTAAQLDDSRLGDWTLDDTSVLYQPAAGGSAR